ncbi:MAG: fibronectin type III domain-containing protein, partial [Actinobacteria bacterium]|nr:fibronectin type III domain-containing protein [Actinomycetota bacterium]
MTKVNADLVAVVDLTNGNVIDSITTGDGPNSVAFTPNGERAFVANESGDSVTIIDATTDSVIGTTAVGDNPFALAITPDGSRVYVTNYGSRSITVLNAGTGSVMGSPIPLAGQPLKFSFTPNGTRAVVATRSPNAAEFVEVASGTSTNSVALGSGPLDVAITPNAGTAYVTNFSAFSVSVISMTATPGAPTSVAGTPGNGEVDLTWTAPTEIGGAPILGYRVEKQLDGGAWEPAIANTGSTSTSATVSGLSNGTGFRFRVAAINSAGPGLASDPSALIVPGLPPGIPTGLTGTPGNAEVLLSWTAPGDDGGTPITGYRIETETDGGPWTTTTANTGTTATTATITGLTNGTPHRFRVSAINTAGPGAPSTPTSTVTPIPTPAPPTSATAIPGNGQVELSWTAPSDDGGSPITGYRIE